MSTSGEIRQKNELVKRRYWSWLKGPEQMSDASIRLVEKAIGKYEEFSDYEDFVRFTDKRAEQFKRYLGTHANERSGRPLGLKSRYYTLRHVRNFFAWLSSQPGYKSRVRPEYASYLKLSRGEQREALSARLPSYPTLEQIRQLCSFPTFSETDRRDRALIAFTSLTGMRDRAVVSLSIRCYDPAARLVKQLPSLGVKTKFNKDIYTTLLPLDSTLTGYFTEWYEYLTREKHYGLDDPLFPSTEIGQIGPDNYAYEAKGVSKAFWADAGSMRTIFRDRCKQMRLPYFYPHTFRHFVTAETEKHITTPEQMKALSQNLGHEHIATTYQAYGAIDPGRVNEIVRSIDFSGNATSGGTNDLARQIAAEMVRLQTTSK